MKKSVLTFLSVIIVCSFLACQQRGLQGNYQEEIEKKAQQTSFAIQNVKDSVSDSIGKVLCTSSINIDYPTKGNPYLLNSIREWIIDWTYANDTIDMNEPLAILRDFNAASIHELMVEAKELNENPTLIENGMELAQEMEIKKIFEDNLFITYIVTTYTYLGGAHGTFTAWGTTFRKSDGKVLDHIFRNDKLTDVQQLISEDLQKQFEVNSWDELREQLFIDEYASYVPMPQSDPYIKNDSIVFCYQQYEIGPYAIGLPAARLAIKDLKEMLAPSFLKNYKTKSTK